MNISASASKLMKLLVFGILSIGINSGRKSNLFSSKQLYYLHAIPTKKKQRNMLQKSMKDQEVLINADRKLCEKCSRNNSRKRHTCH